MISESQVQDKDKRSGSMIFETHAHYEDEQFDSDRDELLAFMPQQGISPAPLYNRNDEKKHTAGRIV